MTLYLRWGWCVLVMLCGGLAVAQDALPPYLYYFSPEHNALVIERADGTDQRLLGEGLAAVGTDSARVYWSPSGKYVAWQTWTYSGPAHINYDFWLMTADGAERITFLDALGNADDVLWSPTEDLLYVVDAHTNGATHYLFNVETRQLITTFTLSNFGADFYQSRLIWTPDGGYVVLFYDISRHRDSLWVERFFRRTVSRTGDIYDQPMMPFTLRSIWNISPTISPMGDVIYTTPDGQWVIENLNTGQTRHYPMEGDIFDVGWSPNSENMLILAAQSCPSVCAATLWAMTPEGVLQVTDNIRSGSDLSPNPHGWTPRGSAELAYFITPNGRLSLYDPTTHEVTTVAGIEGIIVAFWSSDGQSLYAVGEDLDKPAYLYHIPSQTVLPIDGLNGVLTNITSSPDSRYFSLGQRVALLEVQTGEIIPLPRQTDTIDGYVDWHPNSQWLIYNQVLYRSERGRGALMGAVTHLTDSFQRDFSLGFTPAGWLPDAVISYLKL